MATQTMVDALIEAWGPRIGFDRAAERARNMVLGIDEYETTEEVIEHFRLGLAMLNREDYRVTGGPGRPPAPEGGYPWISELEMAMLCAVGCRAIDRVLSSQA